jgi:hypothetical protein
MANTIEISSLDRDKKLKKTLDLGVPYFETNPNMAFPNLDFP